MVAARTGYTVWRSVVKYTGTNVEVNYATLRYTEYTVRRSVIAL